MATLGDLIVRLGLDAADYTNGLSKAEQTASRFATTTNNAFRTVGRAADDSTKSVLNFSNALKGIGVGFGVREVVKLADEYQNVAARLSIVTNSTNELAQVQTKLFNVSQETRTSFAATGNLYFRLATATQDLGTSQGQLINLVDKINKALIISGTSGSTAAGAIEQLSQALGANQLRGQEFNAVNEQANRIIRALADGLGVTIAELREMANQGGISTEVFIRGFTKGAEKLEEEFAKVPLTIQQSLTVAENAIQKFIGETSKSTGAGQALSKSIVFLAENINLLTAAAAGYVAIKLGNFLVEQSKAFALHAETVARNIAILKTKQAAEVAVAAATVDSLNATNVAIVQTRARAAAELALTQSLVARGAVDKAFAAVATANLAVLGAQQASVTKKIIDANTALGAAQSAAATGTGVLARAMGLLGGPIGLVTTALGLGVTAWLAWGGASEDANKKAKEATEQNTKDIIAALNKQNQALAERLRLLKQLGNVPGLGTPAGDEAARLQASARARRESNNIDRLEFLTPAVEQANRDIASVEKRLERLRELLKKNVNAEGAPVGLVGKGIAKNIALAEAELKKYGETLKDVNQEEVAGREEAQARQIIEQIGFAENQKAQIEQIQNLKKEDDILERLGDKRIQRLREEAKIRKELGLADNQPFPPAIQKALDEKFKDKSGRKPPKDDPTKNLLANEIRALEDAIKDEKDLLKDRQNELADTFKEGLVSVQDYYDQLGQAQAANLVATLNYYDEIIQKEKEFIQSSTDATDRSAAFGRVEAAQRKQRDAIRETFQAEQELNRNRRVDAQAYADNLSELNAKMLELAGNTAKAAEIRFNLQNRVFENLLRASGNQKGLDDNDALRKQAIVQGELTDAAKKYALVLGELELAQAKVNEERQLGNIGELSALFQLSAANRERIAQLKELADIYTKIAEKSKDPADILKAKQLQQAVESLGKQLDLVADKFNNILGDAFADNLTALVTGAKSLKDAIKDFGKQVNEQIVRTIADEFKAKLFGQGGVLSGLGKGLGNLLTTGKITAEVDPAKAAANAAEIAAKQATTAAETQLVATTELASLSMSEVAAAATVAAQALATVSASSTASSVSKLFGGGPPITDFSDFFAGGGISGGGLAVVGEQGPELVNLPPGSKVTPNGRFREAMGSNANITINFNGVKPDTASVRQVRNAARDGVMSGFRDR